MDASEWKTTLERMVESLEREIQVKRGELAELESSLAGARSMLKLPAALLKSALPGNATPTKRPAVINPPATPPGGTITIRSAMREAIKAQTGEFTNPMIFKWMNDRYPGAFQASQSASVSSVMAKFGHQGLIRQVRALSGQPVVWEKVPGQW